MFQNITCTDFNKVSQITEGDYEYHILTPGQEASSCRVSEIKKYIENRLKIQQNLLMEYIKVLGLFHLRQTGRMERIY